MKSILSLVLALVMCLSCAAFAEDATPVYLKVGDTLPDFTVTTIDGQTFTLSEALKEKDMVLINLWATWCGPCRDEFPFMVEAYEQYKDKVEVIALSIEDTDTTDVLTEYAASMGMTFLVGPDSPANGGPDLFSQMWVDGEPASGIPTSLVVDRNGVICFAESGSLPDVASFQRLFDVFVGEDYTESKLLDTIPPAMPNVPASPEADVAAALECAAAVNPTDEFTWPMVVAEKDGRSVVAASNVGVNSSNAVVTVPVTAKAGDAVLVTFKTSTEAGCDLLTIAVNGEQIKAFAGEHDWMTYAWTVEADGEYNVTLSYVKDMAAEAGEDCVWVDSVAVKSGEEAAAAVAANPAYPVADEFTLTLVNANAKEILITDPMGVMPMYFGESRYFIVNDDVANFVGTLTADIDPETGFFYNNYDGATVGLTSAMTEAGYEASCGMDTMDTTGYAYTDMYLYGDANGENMLGVTIIRDEKNANAFIDFLVANGLPVEGWTYADGSAPATEERPADAVATAATYTVKYVDQDGNPVAGVMLQVCDEETCQVMMSDENGVVSFTTMPYAWELHTLKVPDGYTGDTQTVTVATVEGGEWTFVLTRN